MTLHGILAGRKTYILAALGILTAACGYLDGDLDAGQALQALLAALTAATIRHGVTTEIQKTNSPQP
ncbi:MAG: hypothetical protein JWN34_364 [Bryobacterales bacterium]|nr:hypothetical protein [Bryobacterales bacterium]